MLTFAYVVTFILGTLVGSFLNVVGLRFLKGESIVWPGSHCPVCHHALKARENIPIVSWLYLRGKCAYCQVSISPQYPLIECLTGFLFWATVYCFGFTVEAGFLLYLICNFVVVLITDFREQSIFEINSLGLIPFGIAFSAFNLLHAPALNYTLHLGAWHFGVSWMLLSSLFAILGAYVLFWVLDLMSRFLVKQSGFGAGDTHLLMGMGAFFGFKMMILIFIVGFLCQALVGIPMMLWQWILKKAYGPLLGLVLAGFLAIMPSFLHDMLANTVIIIAVTFISMVLILIILKKSFSAIREMDCEYLVIPFGPALILACLGLMYFYHPMAAWLKITLPV